MDALDVAAWPHLNLQKPFEDYVKSFAHPHLEMLLLFFSDHKLIFIFTIDESKTSTNTVLHTPFPNELSSIITTALGLGN